MLRSRSVIEEYVCLSSLIDHTEANIRNIILKAWDLISDYISPIRKTCFYIAIF